MYADGTWVKFTTSGRLFPHIKCKEPETGVIVAGWEDDGATLYAVVPYKGNERAPTKLLPVSPLLRHQGVARQTGACRLSFHEGGYISTPVTEALSQAA